MKEERGVGRCFTWKEVVDLQESRRKKKKKRDYNWQHVNHTPSIFYDKERSQGWCVEDINIVRNLWEVNKEKDSEFNVTIFWRGTWW